MLLYSVSQLLSPQLIGATLNDLLEGAGVWDARLRIAPQALPPSCGQIAPLDAPTLQTKRQQFIEPLIERRTAHFVSVTGQQAIDPQIGEAGDPARLTVADL